MFLSNGGHETVIRAMASTSRSGFLTREWALFFWSKLRDFNMATRKESDAVTDPGLSAGIKTGRRDFLKAAVTIAGAVAFGAATMPRVFASSRAPETTRAKLGFIALTDAAPLFVALEKGFFAKHGMTDVSVEKQTSWGTTRDNLVLASARNGIDGAHLLTPMAYLMTAGAITNGTPVPINILPRLNVNGQ